MTIVALAPILCLVIVVPLCLLGAMCLLATAVLRKSDSGELRSSEGRSLEELWGGLTRAEERIARLERVLRQRLERAGMQE
jgi:hypothetical protein